MKKAIRQFEKFCDENYKKTYFKKLDPRVSHRGTEQAKLTIKAPTLTVRELVLIKQGNVPSLYWLRGQVCGLNVDNHGVVRLVALQTIKGSIRKPTTKLTKLPFEAIG